MQHKIHLRHNEPEKPHTIAQPTHKSPWIKENTALNIYVNAQIYNQNIKYSHLKN